MKVLFSVAGICLSFMVLYTEMSAQGEAADLSFQEAKVLRLAKPDYPSEARGKPAWAARYRCSSQLTMRASRYL